MQLLVEPINYKHAMACIEKNIDIILIGNETFASRTAYNFSLDEIKKIVKSKKTTKVWIKVNAFFFEQDILVLEQYLKAISELSIDMVVFQDYAVAEINHANDLKLNLHYNPETLVTSHGQFDFFSSNQFKGCFLARELLLNEVLEIAQHKQNLKLEIQGFGYGMIMHSRWKLITNFENFYQTNIRKDQTNILIRENMRKIPNLVYEDKHGTHMLTGYVISVLKILTQLNDKIDIISMNFLYINNAVVENITELFMHAIRDVKNNCYDASKYIDELQLLLKNQLISAGFLGGLKDVLHMLKDDNE